MNGLIDYLKGNEHPILQGLFVSVVGIFGVFLVLILFYLFIKLIIRIVPDEKTK